MNINIDIRTMQQLEDNEVDYIELKTSGKVYYKKDGVYIVYKEIEDSMEITNTIKISDGSVSIKKFGPVESLMTFKEDSSTTTKYKTQQGVIFMDIKTNSMFIDLKNDGDIDIKINYSLKAQNLFSCINDINIKISRA